MAEKKPADWERIEVDYRAGVLSLREMAGAHGITEGAIRKRAKRDLWTRDLAAKVRARAEELVRREEVRSTGTRQDKYSEQEVIAAGAEVVASIKLGHRKDIGRARSLAMTLLDELTHQTGNMELFEGLAELLIGSEDDAMDSVAAAKRWQAFNAAMSLGERTKTMKALAETLHKLITLEREAYGLQTGDPMGTGADGLQFIITPVAPRPA